MTETIDPDTYDPTKSLLLDARRRFDAFLYDKKPAHHFLNVSISDYPRRRIDTTLTHDQQVDLEEHYKRNASIDRWETEDGRPLVEESEIFDTIISYLRGTGILSKYALYKTIAAHVAGIQRVDVNHAIELWHEYSLGLLKAYDDSLWDGVPATKLSSDRAGCNASASDNNATTEKTSRRSATLAITSTLDSSQDVPKTSANLAPRKFHPVKREAMCIGRSAVDGKAVWLTITERTGAQAGVLHSMFYDDRLNVRSEEELQIRWYTEFQYHRFSRLRHGKSTPKQTQRYYIYQIIIKSRGAEELKPCGDGGDASWPPERSISRDIADETNYILSSSDVSDDGMGHEDLYHNLELDIGHEEDSVSPRKSIGRLATSSAGVNVPGMNDVAQTSPLSNATASAQLPDGFTSQSPYSIETEAFPKASSISDQALPPHAISRTIFLVSASNRPSRAPVYVPMYECGSLEQLFQTLITECGVRDRAASELSEVSVEYTWTKGKRHLIRKDRPRDWVVFVEALCKAWKKESEIFAEDGCEVKMVAHVTA